MGTKRDKNQGYNTMDYKCMFYVTNQRDRINQNIAHMFSRLESSICKVRLSNDKFTYVTSNRSYLNIFSNKYDWPNSNDPTRNDH